VTDTCAESAAISRSRRRSMLLETTLTSLSTEDFVAEAAAQSVEAAAQAQATNVGSATVPMLQRTVDDIGELAGRGPPALGYTNPPRTCGARTPRSTGTMDHDHHRHEEDPIG